jgi:hypothetical protein
MLEQVWRARGGPDADDKAETAGASRFDASRRILEHHSMRNFAAGSSQLIHCKGDSNGCVSIRNNDRFLKALNDGEIIRLCRRAELKG